MEKSELKVGTHVRNIKHGTIEEIIHFGKMKMESGWVDCVIYTGKDRYTGYDTIFCKKTEDFLNEFEFIPEISDMSFHEYMQDVYSQLYENTTEEYRQKYPYNVFGYTKEEIDNNKLYFITCHSKGISAYKALTMFDK